MRSLLATLCFLAFTLSCSEPPPVQQAAPVQSAAQAPVVETPLVETPTVEKQAETQPVETPQEETISRLAVGDQAPNFQLQDQDGTDRTLDGLLAEGKVALVFHRSADW